MITLDAAPVRLQGAIIMYLHRLWDDRRRRARGAPVPMPMFTAQDLPKLDIPIRMEDVWAGYFLLPRMMLWHEKSPRAGGGFGDFWDCAA
jgi:hypothetical protein